MKPQSPDDKKKIEAYRKTLGKYPKPSVTADIVAVRPAYSELDEGQWRENPEFALEVLFIKRGQWPFEGSWALPGGFIRPTETVDEGARRELREETALEATRLIPVGVFSKPDRDMRAWIISNAFVSVHKRGQGCHVKGGDDAAMARWLLLKSPTIGHGRFQLPFHADGKLAFCLTGSYQEEDLGGGTVKVCPRFFYYGVQQLFVYLLSLASSLLVLCHYAIGKDFARYFSARQSANAVTQHKAARSGIRIVWGETVFLIILLPYFAECIWLSDTYHVLLLCKFKPVRATPYNVPVVQHYDVLGFQVITVQRGAVSLGAREAHLMLVMVLHLLHANDEMPSAQRLLRVVNGYRRHGFPLGAAPYDVHAFFQFKHAQFAVTVVNQLSYSPGWCIPSVRYLRRLVVCIRFPFGVTCRHQRLRLTLWANYAFLLYSLLVAYEEFRLTLRTLYLQFLSHIALFFIGWFYKLPLLYFEAIFEFKV